MNPSNAAHPFTAAWTLVELIDGCTMNRMEWPGYSVIADIGMARRGPDYRDDVRR